MTREEIDKLLELPTLKDKVVLGFDFQGWPVEAETLKEVLLQLGFIETDKGLLLEKSEEHDALLNAYPRLLEDDGMAYGVNPQYVTEGSDDVYETEVGGKTIKVFNLFREKYYLDKMATD